MTTKLIVAKTNLNGDFIYCNHSFIGTFSYTICELMTQNITALFHNSWPKVMNEKMWQTLKDDNDFCCFAELLAKDGNTSWHFCTFAPSINEHGQKVGYLAVLRPPSEAGTFFFRSLYQRMKLAESSPENPCQSLGCLTSLLNETGETYEASTFKLQFA